MLLGLILEPGRKLCMYYISGKQNVAKYIHLTSREGENNKCYVKYEL